MRPTYPKHPLEAAKRPPGFEKASPIKPRSFKIGSCTGWKETNIDLLSLKNGASMAATHDGVIADDDGEVVAYWASFLTQTIEGGRLRDGQYPSESQASS